MSLLIKNGRVITHRGSCRTNVLVEGGKISGLTAGQPEAERVIDAAGMWVMPGVVDPHVHFRQPGMDSEDWRSGSMAALAGGVTTVLDMPNTDPPLTTAERLEEKRALVGATSSINYGFHFGGTAGNIREVLDVACGDGLEPDRPPRTRVASVKIYMGSSTGELLLTDLSVIRRLIDIAPIVTVHAEDEEVIRDCRGGASHSLRRPKGAAFSAIKKLLTVGRAGKVYVCHNTSYEEVNLAAPFYREVTPHHLILNESAMDSIGNYAKVNPPLRSEADRISLWRALSEGRVTTIGSDHAPHLRSAKDLDPIRAPSGVPGVETSLPLMVNASLSGQIAPERVVELMSYNPARVFRLRGKGTIERGADADIVVIDPREEREVRARDLHYKCGWTPFEGMTLRGWPAVTVVGGEIAYEGGEFHLVKGREVTYDRP